MTLEEIQAFIAVVDHGSVLAAADALGVARTTLRRRLDDLEARVGVPLLHRHAAGAVATEAGQVLVRQGRRMLKEASALLATVRELGVAPSGRVRLVAPPGMPPHLVVPMVLAIRTQLPDISLDLRFDTDPVGDLLGDVDLAFQLGASLPEGPWIGFVVHRIPERLVASSSWIAAHGAPRTLTELAGQPLFCWAAPDRPAHALPLVGGGWYGVDPVLVSTDIHLLRQCALAGEGLALVPDALVPDPGFEGDPLVHVLPDVVGRVVAARIVVPEAVADLPKVKAVVDQIRAITSALPAP